MIDKQNDSNGNKELSEKQAKQLAKERDVEALVLKLGHKHLTLAHKHQTGTSSAPPPTIEDESWAMKHWWNPRVGRSSLFTAMLIGGFVALHLDEDTKAVFRFDVFVIISIIATPFIYISTWLATKKSFIMRSWCRKHDWKFSRDSAGTGLVGNTAALQKSKLYDLHGDSSYTMSKEFGANKVVLTRHKREHRGKQNTRTSTFLFMNYEGQCPDMVIHGHHKTDLIKLPGQMPTVKFESDEFNSKWTVKSEDAKAAYDRLDQSTMEYLLSVDIPLIIEFIGGLLIIQSQVDTIQNRVRLIKFAQGLTMAVPDDLMPSIEMLPKDSDE